MLWQSVAVTYAEDPSVVGIRVDGTEGSHDEASVYTGRRLLSRWDDLSRKRL